MNFKEQCENIKELDTDLFMDAKWNSELDINNIKTKTKISKEDIVERINDLSDEDTKYRLGLWMDKNPSEVYGNLGLSNLKGYIMFVYREHSLAVFESFESGNAYYTFKCHDIDKMLSAIAELSKTQMMLSNNFLNRGYHIQDKERLQDKVEKMFIHEEISLVENA